MNSEHKVPLDLSKTVPISEEEERKLSAFLSNLSKNIKGDNELEALLGGPVGQWSRELSDKGIVCEEEKAENEGKAEDKECE